MKDAEVKKIVAEMLNEGTDLSEIQKILDEKHGVRMTFLDLRLLASELEEVDWQKLNQEEEETDSPQEEENTTPSGETMVDASGNPIPQETDGKTVVEISKLARPGAVASGSVTFASGASAEWILDQMGRLGLEKTNGEPTPEDLKEFQVELQNAIANGGL